MPFLTNSLEVYEGEELILEVREKKHEKGETKRTWKDAFAAEAKSVVKAEAKRVGKPRKKSPFTDP